ncbi:MAG: ATP-binding cassette domain-containing protein [Chloroflexi bacterium]|nr:ATP-binding cassette domain-containing protein [Chloroflexota bacterium]
MTAQLDKMDHVAIDLQHLSKVYGSGHVAVKAIDDVSLHVLEGEIVAVMGPSGSGKTTLLQVIGALLKPTSGDVIVNGTSISACPEGSLCQVRLQTFGFIFQTPNLLSALTAVQNVELAMNLAGAKGEKARQKARQLLEELNLEMRLGHRPANLSGGEQQRVAIARALANDPPILLADEPTANLDSKTGQGVMELLRKIAKDKGKTAVIVSHDLRIRYFADRVLWLEDGRLRPRWSEGVTIDPVCLMAVEKDKTTNVIEYEGEKFYFCSLECRREFEKAPSRFKESKLRS